MFVSALAVLAQLAAPTEPVALARALFDAVMSGQWFLATSIGLMVLVFGLRRLPWAPLQTDVGGVLLNFGSSLALAFFTSAAAGVGFSVPVLLTALEVSGGAAVAYMLLKKFAFPLLLKIPALASLWALVAALFPAKGDVVAPVVAAPVTAPTPEDVANAP